MKINAYENDESISLNDKVTGTDAEDANKTKNYTFQKIKDFLIVQGLGGTTYVPLYKSYHFRLSQAGDLTDPTVVEFKNDIGSIVWTRTNVGRYRATLTGAFNTAKTSVGQINRCQHSGLYTRNIFVNHTSNNYFEIWVTNQTEAALEGLYEEFEIRVYN